MMRAPKRQRDSKNRRTLATNGCRRIRKRAHGARPLLVRSPLARPPAFLLVIPFRWLCIRAGLRLPCCLTCLGPPYHLFLAARTFAYRRGGGRLGSRDDGSRWSAGRGIDVRRRTYRRPVGGGCLLFHLSRRPSCHDPLPRLGSEAGCLTTSCRQQLDILAVNVSGPTTGHDDASRHQPTTWRLHRPRVIGSCGQPRGDESPKSAR